MTGKSDQPIKRAFQNLFRPQGRASRLEYFVCSIFITIINILIGVITEFFDPTLTMLPLYLIIDLATTFILYCAISRRLHDIGSNGRLTLICYIIYAIFVTANYYKDDLIVETIGLSGMILLLIFVVAVVIRLLSLLFIAGQRHTNSYGMQPGMSEDTAMIFE